jgi:uncharacterized protein (TIGR01777 family)
MATILITGGTGLIGLRLAEILKSQGHRLHLLSRSNRSVKPYDAVFSWDVKNGTMNEIALDGVEVIVHLAGAGIADQRWTDERKAEILSSRVDSAKLLLDTLKHRNQSISVFVSGSAIGWYGAYSDSLIHNETEPAASDFMGETCRKWEYAADLFHDVAERIVKIRTGVVLDKNSGALPKMAQPVQWFVGSPLGTGKQQIPWIHLEDICAIFANAVSDSRYYGSINAIATENCTNKEFTKVLAKVLHRPILPIHVPSFVINALFGEMALVVLEGSRVSNHRIKQMGYNFKFSNLEEALKDILVAK